MPGPRPMSPVFLDAGFGTQGVANGSRLDDQHGLCQTSGDGLSILVCGGDMTGIAMEICRARVPDASLPHTGTGCRVRCLWEGSSQGRIDDSAQLGGPSRIPEGVGAPGSSRLQQRILGRRSGRTERKLNQCGIRQPRNWLGAGDSSNKLEMGTRNRPTGSADCGARTPRTSWRIGWADLATRSRDVFRG